MNIFGIPSRPCRLPCQGQTRRPSQRRAFTAEYKLGILADADAAAARPGAIGALLRREGLYSSHLAAWRRERQAGTLRGLTQPHKLRTVQGLQKHGACRWRRKRGTKMAAKWCPAKGAVRSEPFPLLRSVVRNGPEPSRARRCWARRSEPLTARTVLR